MESLDLRVALSTVSGFDLLYVTTREFLRFVDETPFDGRDWFIRFFDSPNLLGQK